jgi:hypothetical protein
MVDYIIYDKVNITNFLDYDDLDYLNDGWWMQNDRFRVSSKFNNAYHYDIYRAMYNAIGLVNSLGYEFFVFVEGDCILKDFEKLNQLRDRMFSEQRKMLFGKIIINVTSELSYDNYCTLLYGGVPSYFLSKTDISYDLMDWVNKPTFIKELNQNIYLTQRGLEVIFHECFHKYLDEILELEFFGNMENIMEYNRIKSSTEYGLSNIFYFNELKPDRIYVFLHNNNEYPVDIKLYFNDALFLEQPLTVNEWILREMDLQDIFDKKAKLLVYINNEIEAVIERELNEKNIDKMRKSHKFIEY